jgi:YD repeat-containing protein
LRPGNGNTTREILGNVSADYAYDPENRVTEINNRFSGFLGLDPDTKTTMVQYEYDAFGRKNSRTGYTEKEKHGVIEQQLDTKMSYLYEGLGFNVLRVHSRAVRNERPGLRN